MPLRHAAADDCYTDTRCLVFMMMRGARVSERMLTGAARLMRTFTSRDIR